MSTEIPPSHVDGHHHLHMHPFIFDQCVRCAEYHGFARIRVTREFGNPLPPRKDGSGFVIKLFQHLVFSALSKNSERRLAGSSLRRLTGVLGLWESGRMNEDYLLKAIPQLAYGDWEVYVHLGSQGAEEELSSLLSPSLKQLFKERNIGFL